MDRNTNRKRGNAKNLVLITGTPGTGKSTLAKELSLSYKKDLINITDFCRRYGLFERFDADSCTYDVDIDKMRSELLKFTQNAPGILIIDGHLSHFLPSERVISCIVCTTELKTLKERLQKRPYSDEKVHENLDAEIFETCRIEAQERGHDILTINTTEPIEDVMKANRDKFDSIFTE